MRYRWRSSYHKQTIRYLEKHFGSAQGVTNLFPYMKADFNVKGNKNVFDPRVMLKTNNEYHGLERHARRYQSTSRATVRLTRRRHSAKLGIGVW